jgi:hypothetical protein
MIRDSEVRAIEDLSNSCKELEQVIVTNHSGLIPEAFTSFAIRS